MLIKEVFSDLGFNVAEAKSFGEAVNIAASFNPDVALIDMKLGIDSDYDGVDVIEALKAINPEVIFIIITADIECESIKRAFTKGVFCCLGKPFDIDFLIYLVNKLYDFEETKTSRL